VESAILATIYGVTGDVNNRSTLKKEVALQLAAESFTIKSMRTVSIESRGAGSATICPIDHASFIRELRSVVMCSTSSILHLYINTERIR
jgi:hypothetical protein